MRAAFDSLPDDLQASAERHEDRGQRALRSAYLRERALRNPFPNRATRRKAMKGH